MIEPRLEGPFHIALLRSSFLEKDEATGVVFARLDANLGRLSESLSSVDASRSYSSKLLPLMPSSLSDATASSSASASSSGLSPSKALFESSSLSTGSFRGIRVLCLPVVAPASLKSVIDVRALLLRSIFCKAANRFSLDSCLPCWNEAIGQLVTASRISTVRASSWLALRPSGCRKRLMSCHHRSSSRE